MNRPLQRAIAMAVLALASSRAAAQAVDTLRLSDLHRAALARDPALAALSTPQLITLSTLDGDKRDALQQRTLW